MSAVAGRLAGKTALVTGGSSGIGLATAKRFAGEGAHVFITGRRAEALAAAAADIGPEVTYPIYRNGTIGKAKEDLENTAARLTARLADLKGRAWVSVNKAVVTQASSERSAGFLGIPCAAK